MIVAARTFISRWAIVGVGVALLALSAGHLGLDGAFVTDAIEVALPVVAALAIIAFGRWAGNHWANERRVALVAGWQVAGGVALAATVRWILFIVSLSGGVPADTYYIVLNGVAIGVLGNGALGVLYYRVRAQRVDLQVLNDELQRQNDRLDSFSSIVSHDLRNPLNVAIGGLELARETGDAADFERVEKAHGRIDAIIDDTLTLAREGWGMEATERVELASVAESAWRNVSTDDVTLRIEDSVGFDADRGRLKRAFENLVHNAVEHGGPTLSAVRVGALDGGFYVEDDGAGIPETNRERVFDSGFTTAADGTGFGLAIVEAVFDSHGWESRATESHGGGTRIEVTGVQTHARDSQAEPASDD